MVPDDTGRVQPHSNPVWVNQTRFHGEIKIEDAIHIFINATHSTALVQSRMWLWITIWEATGLRKNLQIYVCPTGWQVNEKRSRP